MEKVINYVKKHKMIRPGEHLVAGISGGADSVCLFFILFQICVTFSCHFSVVHINHNLRGDEAKRDESFVEQLCKRYGIPFRAVQVQVKELAKERGISLEEAGRIARYQAFETYCREYHGDKIVLAHHENDLAETMIHHLARGTGISGLCSLQPVSGNRIRPLLCLSRSDIESYLKKIGEGYQTDSSNEKDDYTRNKIRHHVLAYLTREINPQTTAHMAQTSEELREVEELLQGLTKDAASRWVEKGPCESRISLQLCQEPKIIQKRILLQEFRRIAGSSKDFGRVHMEDVLGLLDKQVGRKVDLPYGLQGEREYQTIWIGKKRENKTSSEEGVKLAIPGVTEFGGYHLECQIVSGDFSLIEEKKYTKWLDYDRIEQDLELRHRKAGDRISICQSGGSKKLKDYLIDRKIPQKDRDGLWLVAKGNEVLWIIGDRISEKYKVSDGTKRMLYIQIKGGEIHE